MELTAKRSLEIITEQIEKSRQAVSKDTGRWLFVTGLIAMIMSVIVASINILTLSPLAHLLWFALPVVIWLVMKYINQNYMYEIPLEKIASIAGYSKYHFSRIFKKYNNVSYIQYINSKRIKAAERLLIDPNLSVTEVAMRAGFASLTTFNRAFKKAKNCTPTEFKTLYKISDNT